MLFLFYTFFLILLILLIILSIKIQIRVENLKYSSELINEASHLNKEYIISICMYTLNKIPVLRIKLTKDKFHQLNQKTHIKEKLEKQMKEQNLKQLSEKYDVTKDFKEIIKNINIRTNKLDLKLEIGTQNVILTSFLIPAISTILAIILYKTGNKSKKQKYKVEPIYQNKNLINFQLDGIFDLKLIHIITTICILKKKRRVEKYERTSNRRSYDYSYE